jgi:hypothetical protein
LTKELKQTREKLTAEIEVYGKSMASIQERIAKLQAENKELSKNHNFQGADQGTKIIEHEKETKQRIAQLEADSTKWRQLYEQTLKAKPKVGLSQQAEIEALKAAFVIKWKKYMENLVYENCSNLTYSFERLRQFSTNISSMLKAYKPESRSNIGRPTLGKFDDKKENKSASPTG